MATPNHRGTIEQFFFQNSPCIFASSLLAYHTTSLVQVQQFYCKKFHWPILLLLPVAYHITVCAVNNCFPRNHLDRCLPLVAYHATVMDAIEPFSFKNPPPPVLRQAQV